MANCIGSALAVGAVLLTGCFESGDPGDLPDAASFDAAGGADGGPDGAYDGNVLDGGAALRCELPVRTGEYTLNIVGLANARGGFALELRADGTFTGIPPQSEDRCEGSLMPAEAENIATALNAANTFCRRDITDCLTPEADNTYLDVSIRTTDLGRENRFCFVACARPYDEAMGAVVQALFAPLMRVWIAGDCTPTTYSPPTHTDRCPAR